MIKKGTSFRAVTWIAVLLSCSVTLFAQVGEVFPPLSGELLNGESVQLPYLEAEKPTVIGLAYSKKAEEALKTWYTPMYDTFVLQRGIFDHLYASHFYMVPMFTGVKQAAYEKALKEMRKSNRKDLFPHILFYKGSIDLFVSVLKMDDKKEPYLFVIDQSGKVVYATKGVFTERKKEALETVLEGL